MLILIGCVPLAYSLNKNLDAAHIQSFGQLSAQTADAIYPQHEDIPDEKLVPSLPHTFKLKN